MLFELIIFVHEFGHFIAAKKSGVKVNEFALGMGPRLFGFTKGETKYSFRLFPIGGYCAMEGEDEDSENPRAFNNAKIWKRMIIIVAGAFMNIMLGLILMFITLIPKDSFTSTEVSNLQPYSWTALGGLQQGDKIVRINGYDVNTATDFSFALYTLPVTEVSGEDFIIYKEDCAFDMYVYAIDGLGDLSDEIKADVYKRLDEFRSDLINAKTKDKAYKLFCACYEDICKSKGEEFKEYPEIELRETRKRYRTDITVIRNGERVELKDVDFVTLNNPDGDKPNISVDFTVLPIEKNFGTMITQTFAETGSNIRMVWEGLARLVTGKMSFNEMSGPIGIASAITEVASQSLETDGFGSAVMNIINVMMIITINLGIINMLPFPALDGGRFLMLLIEAIFRKPVPRKVEKIINVVGLVLLLGLSAVIAVKDIVQIAGGG